MNSVAIFCSLLATFISVFSLTRLAITQHNRLQPRTLSELAASEDYLLRRFRLVLLLCGTLFSIALFGYLVPQSAHPLLLLLAWALAYIGDALSGVVPAKGNSVKLHELSAQIMAFGMVVTAYVLWLDSGLIVEAVATIAMVVFALATILNPRHFLFYELPFLYLSHVSILAALIIV